ncbi:unnamed protein product [Debaryomyces tyrocola]|nr:unnamed protein product [Debaryomyces tyrocola]
MVPSLFFAVMIVLRVGLPRTPEMFFIVFLIGVISVNCGESLGIIVTSLFKYLGLAKHIVVCCYSRCIYGRHFVFAYPIEICRGNTCQVRFRESNIRLYFGRLYLRFE